MHRPREREPWAQGTCCGVGEGTAVVFENMRSVRRFGLDNRRCANGPVSIQVDESFWEDFWTPKNVEPAVQAIDLRYIFILERI